MKPLLISLSMTMLLATAAAAQRDASPGSQGTGGTTAAAGAAAPSNGAPAARVTADYRLVPGDKLRVEVYKDAQLSQTVQVRPDGKITLPLANDLVAAGQTPAEQRDQIVSSLKPYVSNPTVTVIVMETVPAVVYVMGEVQRAGPHPISGKLDVVQALAMAGGFSDFAKTKDIMIRRGSQIIRFNYNDAVKGKTAPLFLQPGDTIIVP